MFIYRFYCRQYPESKLRFCKDRSLFIDIFSYAGSDMIGSVSVLAQGQGLNILLNMFYGGSSFISSQEYRSARKVPTIRN